jgi:hypothetical protein
MRVPARAPRQRSPAWVLVWVLVWGPAILRPRSRARTSRPARPQRAAHLHAGEPGPWGQSAAWPLVARWACARRNVTRPGRSSAMEASGRRPPTAQTGQHGRLRSPRPTALPHRRGVREARGTVDPDGPRGSTRRCRAGRPSRDHGWSAGAAGASATRRAAGSRAAGRADPVAAGPPARHVVRSRAIAWPVIPAGRGC